MEVVTVPTVAEPVVPETAVKVLAAPEHTVPGVAEAVINAFKFTVIIVVAVLVQPLASVPVTVYNVLADGFADTLLPVAADKPLAGDHAYVNAPPADKAIAVPPGLQIKPVLGATVVVGFAFTVTVTLEVQLAPHASDTVQVNV